MDNTLKIKEENRKLKDALTDLLDGNSKWYDIQAATGLSEERCKEIEKLYQTIK